MEPRRFVVWRVPQVGFLFPSRRGLRSTTRWRRGARHCEEAVRPTKQSSLTLLTSRRVSSGLLRRSAPRNDVLSSEVPNASSLVVAGLVPATPPGRAQCLHTRHCEEDVRPTKQSSLTLLTLWRRSSGLLRRGACARTARSADPGAPRNDGEKLCLPRRGGRNKSGDDELRRALPAPGGGHALFAAIIARVGAAPAGEPAVVQAELAVAARTTLRRTAGQVGRSRRVALVIERDERIGGCAVLVDHRATPGSFCV